MNSASGEKGVSYLELLACIFRTEFDAQDVVERIESHEHALTHAELRLLESHFLEQAAQKAQADLIDFAYHRQNSRLEALAAKSWYLATELRLQAELSQEVIDLLNVLQMQSRWVGARVGLLRVRNAQLAERVDLHLALGGSFE